MTIKKFLKRLHCLLHDDRTVLHEGENIEEWEEDRQKRYEEAVERQKREQAILATRFLQEEYIHAGWFKRFIWRLRFAFMIRMEKVIYLKSQSISVWKSLAVFCLISSLIMSRNRGKKSLLNGRHNRKSRKKKRARSHNLAQKQRQYGSLFESLIVKNKSEPISIDEIVRICYVW